jgi:hypothetical protein
MQIGKDDKWQLTTDRNTTIPVLPAITPIPARYRCLYRAVKLRTIMTKALLRALTKVPGFLPWGLIFLS